MPIETLQLTEGSGGTMSSSEGGSEIQLAKERLASAKARVESASKNFVAAKETKKQVAKTMENAKAHEECASKQLDKAKEATKQAAKTMETAVRGVNTAHLELLSSQYEVKKADESLKATEKRREVVNIDSDSDEEEGNSKKKMKVSTEEVSKGDEDTDGEENNNKQVVIMGCGSAEVNGTYSERKDTNMSKTHGTYKFTKNIIIRFQGSCDRISVFVKEGMWKGKQGAFVLTDHGCTCDYGWTITFWPDSGSLHQSSETERGKRRIMIYRVKDYGRVPPKVGWMKANGASPPPTLQLQNA